MSYPLKFVDNQNVIAIAKGGTDFYGFRKNKQETPVPFDFQIKAKRLTRKKKRKL